VRRRVLSYWKTGAKNISPVQKCYGAGIIRIVVKFIKQSKRYDPK